MSSFSWVTSYYAKRGKNIERKTKFFKKSEKSTYSDKKDSSFGFAALVKYMGYNPDNTNWNHHKCLNGRNDEGCSLSVKLHKCHLVPLPIERMTGSGLNISPKNRIVQARP